MTRCTRVILCMFVILSAAPAQAGLISYWNFNDGTGSAAAADVVGGRTGDLTNMEPATDWVTGRTGGAGDYALDFDGGNEYVNVPTYKGQAGRSARTISAWINASATDDVIVSWGSNTNAQKWVFRTNSNNGNPETLRVEVNGGFQVGSTDIVGTGWTHVVATWENDGTPDVNDVKLYVNGVEESYSATQSNNLNTNTGQDFRIGNESFGARHFVGQIDDVAVWNRVLTPAEIGQLAAGVSPTDIEHYAPLPALNFEAGLDPTPTDGSWEDLVDLTSNHDWAINNNDGGARLVDVFGSYFKTTKAYSFNGSTDTATTATFESFDGNPSNDSASFEILFRPSDTADADVLFETGGTNGTSLAVDGTTLMFNTAQNSTGTTRQLTYDGITTDDFWHAIGVVERTASGASLSLYVNGKLVATDTSGLTDWSGGDGAGLGQQNGSAIGGNYGGVLNGFGNFEGEIAMFRFYDTLLTPADALWLYSAAIPEPGTLALLALGGLGLIRRRRKT